MEGWVKVYRSVLDHWVWNKKPFSKGQAWVDLILLANHQEVKDFSGGMLRIFSKGTVNRSIESLSERWGWDRRKTKRFLNALQADGMVNVNSTTNGTTITLDNYSSFQDIGTTNGTTNGTTDAQPIAQRVPINKNVKNDKNDKKEREEENLPEISVKRFPCGNHQNVFLSNEEAAKLQKEFPNEAADMIEKLSEYMKQNYTKYRNDAHYAILCKWIREDRKKMAAGGKTSASLREEEEINARQRKAIADCGYIGD